MAIEEFNLADRVAELEKNVLGMSTNLNKVAEHFEFITGQLVELQRRDIDFTEKFTAVRIRLAVTEAMVGALLRSSPIKDQVHQSATELWNHYRGGLGHDAVKDEWREEAQQLLTVYGNSLGKPII